MTKRCKEFRDEVYNHQYKQCADNTELRHYKRDIYNLMHSIDLKPHYTSTERPFMLQMDGDLEYSRNEVRNHEYNRDADNRGVQTRQYCSSGLCGAENN